MRKQTKFFGAARPNVTTNGALQVSPDAPIIQQQVAEADAIIRQTIADYPGTLRAINSRYGPIPLTKRKVPAEGSSDQWLAASIEPLEQLDHPAMQRFLEVAKDIHLLDRPSGGENSAEIISLRHAQRMLLKWILQDEGVSPLDVRLTGVVFYDQDSGAYSVVGYKWSNAAVHKNQGKLNRIRELMDLKIHR